MKVLVTGGAGFVGGHLSQKLIDLGHEVLVIDSLFAGKREHIPTKAAFEQIDLGTVDEAVFFPIVKKFSPDIVIHLAAIHFIPYCMSHPNETFYSNVRSTELVCRSLEGLGTRKIIAASTADVYAPLDQVHCETDQPAPVNVYGLSKLLTEQILEYSTRTMEQLEGVSLRFFNIYGPQETNPHLIPRVVDLINNNELNEIRLGYLGASRDFVHVFDVVDAIIASMNSDTGKYNFFNVGTGKGSKVRDVVNRLQAIAEDVKPVIEDKANFRKFDRESLTPNVDKIYQATGWKASISIEEGLKSVF
jgi:UDP-glucose 4-epimerase